MFVEFEKVLGFLFGFSMIYHKIRLLKQSQSIFGEATYAN
ncbi:hypothetical protein LEP1GSC074_0082 [Leptospira noguchii str. Hook]|nr:hypothetical protein LEP1GSC074_0082 [Leptospira noguchii str. Hook]